MILADSWLAVARRWRRNLLTTATVALSAATVVVLVSFVHSAAARTAAALTGLSANAVTVTLPGPAWRIPEAELVRRLAHVPEIAGAGTVVLPSDSGAAVEVRAPRSGVTVRSGVAVATEAGLAARGAAVTAGAYPSAVIRDRQPSVLLGARLAAELHIGDPRGATVTIDGVTLAVAGIVVDGPGGGVLSASVIVDPVTADRLGLLPPSRIIQVAVDRGSAEAIARWLPAAIYPAGPDEVAVSVPLSPRHLQEQIAAESAAWINVITSVLVVVSIVTIMTTMQIAVQERRREIGIRRALGTRASRIGAQFCCESLLIGLMAGLLGASVGMIGIAGFGRLADWVILVPPWLGLVPVGGLVVGGLSGLVPAFLATRVDPAELLRSV